MKLMKNISILILTCIFLFSVSMLIKDLIILPKQNVTSIVNIKNVYYNNNDNINEDKIDNQDNKSNKNDEEVEILNNNGNKSNENNFGELKKLNADIIGWVRIPNTVIDYPVLQSDISEPEYYLKRDYNENVTKYGSIFLDSRCDLIGQSENLTLYGHNMKNGQMFADLLKYSDLEFYKSSPIVYFNINGKDEVWKRVTIFKIDVSSEQYKNFDYTNPELNNDNDFAKFVKKLKDNSIINIPVDVKEDDIFLTMSTCSYEKKDNRTVVVSRKLRDSESKNVDVDKAYYNNK